MKLNIYSIYDTAAALYLRPLFAQSDGEAIRAFSDAVLNKDTEYGKHPEDYSLFRGGIFDDNTFALTNEDKACLLTGLMAVANSRKINTNNVEQMDLDIAAGGSA